MLVHGYGATRTVINTNPAFDAIVGTRKYRSISKVVTAVRAIIDAGTTCRAYILIHHRY